MEFTLRPAHDGDADAISQVILAALHESNAKDYSPAVIARVAEHFRPATIVALLQQRTVLVAEIAGRVVGTASLDGAVIRTVFIDPACQRLGIGRQLLHALEAIARDRNLQRLSVPSSLTAEAFYARLGFVAVREIVEGDERTIVMTRVL